MGYVVLYTTTDPSLPADGVGFSLAPATTPSTSLGGAGNQMGLRPLPSSVLFGFGKFGSEGWPEEKIPHANLSQTFITLVVLPSRLHSSTPWMETLVIG